MSSTPSEGNLIKQFEVPKLDWKVIGAYALANFLVFMVLYTSVKEPIVQGKSISFVAILVLLLIIAGWGGANYLVIKQNQKRIKTIEFREQQMKLISSVDQRIISYEDIQGVSWNFYKVGNKPSDSIVVEVNILLEEEKITFRSHTLPNVEELGNLLEEVMVQKYLDEAVDKIREGEKVSFGIVEIDREGIYFDNYVFWWSEISGLYLSEGNLSVEDQNNQVIALIPQNQLRNIQLLGLLGNELIQVHKDHTKNETESELELDFEDDI